MKSLTLAALFGLITAKQTEPGVFEMEAHVRSKNKKAKQPKTGLQALFSTQDDYVDKILYDFNNIQIYSKIYIGSDRQEFDFIFDTGSSWVWVADKVCHACANENKYDHDKSKTFRQLTSDLSSLRYGQGAIWGFDTTDQICLAKDSQLGNGCMANYLFKNVVNQEDLGGLFTSGLIGLAPDHPYNDAQLFVPSLYKQGAIKKNMFSIFIDQDGTSKIQYGGYDLKKYAQGPIHWFDITSLSFWSLNFHDVKIGG